MGSIVFCEVVEFIFCLRESKQTTSLHVGALLQLVHHGTVQRLNKDNYSSEVIKANYIKYKNLKYNTFSQVTEDNIFNICNDA